MPARFNPGMWWAAALGTIVILLTTYPIHLILLNRGLARWGSEMDAGSVQEANKRTRWLVQASVIVLSFLGILVSILLLVWSQVDLEISQVLALLAGQNP